MERLTKRNPTWLDEEFWISAEEPDEETIDNIYLKLKSYEDAEESGRLLVLPCKVGDTVYITGHKYRGGKEEYWINTGKFRISDIEKLGDTVFLSKEEAEAKLKEV